MSASKTTLQGPSKAIWIYGIVFSAMFILYSFTNLGLAFLGADYSQIGGPMIFGAYGIVHLVTNNAFKTRREWGRLGLILIYGLWTVYSVYKIIVGTDPMSLATVAVFGPLSLAAVGMLTRHEGSGKARVV